MTWRKLVATGPWLLSPHLPAWQKKIVGEMRRRVPKGALWILSSGTQSVGRVKAIGLTEENFFSSAAAVNKHLESTRQDRWMRAIPSYHVGGAGIYARAALTGAKVVEFAGKWAPARFVRELVENKISLTSLVPTQVFDLVTAGLRAPPALRDVVVGGGALAPDLYARAGELGWPLRLSYGLTESCSQVATSPAGSPKLLLLPHVEAEIRDGRIFLRSKAICKWVATMNREGLYTLEDPAPTGWLGTQDRAELIGRELKVLGRSDDVVKILGSLVSLLEVEHDAQAIFPGPSCVLALAAERAGHELVLVTEDISYREMHRRLDQFNGQRMGPLRLQGVACVRSLPRNEMGKINKTVLRQSLLL